MKTMNDKTDLISCDRCGGLFERGDFPILDEIMVCSNCTFLDKEITKLQRCLGFFASVIKSGEPWTNSCQREYDLAMGHTRKD